MLGTTWGAASAAPMPSTCGCSCGPGRRCDGLECLCRPRYFAGQLLTDEDLRRLDHYVVAKNRLHNRYLHGTGVVCGLEVVCNPCDPTVTVRTGFAIGPCGEDIVVCADTSVDVAQLVRDQRKAHVDDCMPYGARPVVDCEGARQRWILAICYEERPSRGVTSYVNAHRRVADARARSAASGGGGNGHATATDVCSCRRRPATPAQCEPTVTCEGYYFKLYKEPLPTRTPVGRRPRSQTVQLGQRVQACLHKPSSASSRLHAGVAGDARRILLPAEGRPDQHHRNRERPRLHPRKYA